MSGSGFCDGCAWLRYEEQVNRYDVHRALCCDPDKPVLGARRVVATSGVAAPRCIPRPERERGRPVCAGTARGSKLPRQTIL